MKNNFLPNEFYLPNSLVINLNSIVFKQKTGQHMKISTIFKKINYLMVKIKIVYFRYQWCIDMV